MSPHYCKCENKYANDSCGVRGNGKLPFGLVMINTYCSYIYNYIYFQCTQRYTVIEAIEKKKPLASFILLLLSHFVDLTVILVLWSVLCML